MSGAPPALSVETPVVAVALQRPPPAVPREELERSQGGLRLRVPDPKEGSLQPLREVDQDVAAERPPDLDVGPPGGEELLSR